MAVFNRNAPYSETSDPNALIVIEPEYPAVFSISYDHGYCVRNRGEMIAELTPKRLELLSELVPEAKVFA